MRQINWDEELSDEDRAWAEQRPDAPAGEGKLIRDRLAANDEKFGRAEKTAAKSRSERIEEIRTQQADLDNELARLLNEQAQEDNPNIAVAGDPAVGVVRDNTAIDGQKPDGAPEAREDYSDTKYWTVPRLQQEIDVRNVDRTSQDLPAIDRNGKRAELVERLMKDDEELEG